MTVFGYREIETGMIILLRDDGLKLKEAPIVGTNDEDRSEAFHLSKRHVGYNNKFKWIDHMDTKSCNKLNDAIRLRNQKLK